MNNPTSTKKSSTPSKSNRAERARKRIKAPAEDGVEAQLAGCEASEEAGNGIDYHGTSLETTPAETASVENLVVLPAQTVSLPKSLMNLPRGLTAR